MPRKKATKKQKQQYLHEGSDYLFSLSAFTGKKIADVLGYPGDPFGNAPVFVIRQILFDDGTAMHAEGEHDTAYLPSDNEFPNMDEATLARFIEE